MSAESTKSESFVHSPTNPYAAQHADPQGPGDQRPTALQIIEDEGLENALTGKVFLITGTTSGLGLETARALHATGADIYMQVREVAKGEPVRAAILSSSPGYGKIEIIEMDLSSFESIRKGANTFLQKSGGRLNVLLNNAGVGGGPEVKTVDGFESKFGINHLAHFLLFQLLCPALLSSAAEPSNPPFASRVINVTSGAHGRSEINFENPNLVGCYDNHKSYAQSKAANILMANEIENLYGSRGVHGLSVHPGVIPTNIGRDADREWTERALRAVGPGLKNAQQGAATQVWAAVGKVWEGKGKKYLANVAEQLPNPSGVYILGGYSPYCFREDISKRLWEMSCELVSVDDKVL